LSTTFNSRTNSGNCRVAGTVATSAPYNKHTQLSNNYPRANYAKCITFSQYIIQNQAAIPTEMKVLCVNCNGDNSRFIRGSTFSHRDMSRDFVVCEIKLVV